MIYFDTSYIVPPENLVYSEAIELELPRRLGSKGLD